MESKIILLDNGHGEDTDGKRSPDGLFREYAFARIIVKGIYNKLKADGYDVRILVPEENDIALPVRCQRANDICNKVGANNVLLISVHADAAPQKHEDGWESARGWSGWVYRNASGNSIKLADCLFDAAEKKGFKMRRQYADRKYWEAGYYILKHTACPAVLTENLFQNNHEDVAILMSEEGQQKIIDLHVEAIKKYLKKK